MRYVFIDTNIWLRMISQGRPGCEFSYLDELRSQIEDSRITLLMPEIVQLELRKSRRSFNERVDLEVGKLLKDLESITRKPTWTEIEDIRESLGDFVSSQAKEKISAATARFDNVETLLALPTILVLPFTQEIHFRGRRRLMMGRMPFPENQALSDACLLESLADFFLRNGSRDEHELCFCSENVKDFGLVAKDRHIIHPLHKEELPAATEYCISLEKAVAFLKSNRPVVPPTPVVIEQALQQEAEDEIDVADAEIYDENNKSDDLCAATNCFAPRFALFRHCKWHHDKYWNALSEAETEDEYRKINSALATLTYREREIVKLRWGLTDGTVYTPSECARIFRISPQRIGQLEAKAVRKLRRIELVAKLFS